ncbi:unannotated protein [freshwater metagenome]|uniref:Unannotated protein n=1 Tax=freshwater metagenome TaxID=449393 RepID=A0A6J5Z4X5_9ZZZZ
MKFRIDLMIPSMPKVAIIGKKISWFFSPERLSRGRKKKYSMKAENAAPANIAIGSETQNEPVFSRTAAPTNVEARARPPAAKLTTRVLRQTKTIAIAISE